MTWCDANETATYWRAIYAFLRALCAARKHFEWTTFGRRIESSRTGRQSFLIRRATTSVRADLSLVS